MMSDAAAPIRKSPNTCWTSWNAPIKSRLKPCPPTWSRWDRRYATATRQPGGERTVTLVFPGVEDAATGAVSILTPVGAALIGMRPGARIDWTAPSGDQRILTVLEVRPPERSQ